MCILSVDDDAKRLTYLARKTAKVAGGALPSRCLLMGEAPRAMLSFSSAVSSVSDRHDLDVLFGSFVLSSQSVTDLDALHDRVLEIDLSPMRSYDARRAIRDAKVVAETRELDALMDECF